MYSVCHAVYGWLLASGSDVRGPPSLDVDDLQVRGRPGSLPELIFVDEECRGL